MHNRCIIARFAWRRVGSFLVANLGHIQMCSRCVGNGLSRSPGSSVFFGDNSFEFIYLIILDPATGFLAYSQDEGNQKENSPNCIDCVCRELKFLKAFFFFLSSVLTQNVTQTIRFIGFQPFGHLLSKLPKIRSGPETEKRGEQAVAEKHRRSC